MAFIDGASVLRLCGTSSGTTSDKMNVIEKLLGRRRWRPPGLGLNPAPPSSGRWAM